MKQTVSPALWPGFVVFRVCPSQAMADDNGRVALGRFGHRGRQTGLRATEKKKLGQFGPGLLGDSDFSRYDTRERPWTGYLSSMSATVLPAGIIGSTCSV